MKKVSFIKFNHYSEEQLSLLPDDLLNKHFVDTPGSGGNYLCTESFTAEITVKIIPYEP